MKEIHTQAEIHNSPTEEKLDTDTKLAGEKGGMSEQPYSETSADVEDQRDEMMQEDTNSW